MRFLVIIIFSLSLGCTKSENTYDNSIMDLGLGFVAKHMCSCYFVVQQNEEFCRDSAKIKQISPKIEIGEKSVTASFLFFFKAHADFLGPEAGCTLL